MLLAGHGAEPTQGHISVVCGRWAWQEVAGNGWEEVFIGPGGADSVWALISSLDHNKGWYSQTLCST